MKNEKILYGVIGLLLGLIIGGAVMARGGHWDKSKHYGMEGMHKMKDGMMMDDMKMDMDNMMESMMMGLEGKTGDAFDKAFLSEMIVHHKGAVSMAEAVIKNSKKPELIKLANEIITAQNKEINMMEEWQKAWFK